MQGGLANGASQDSLSRRADAFQAGGWSWPLQSVCVQGDPVLDEFGSSNILKTVPLTVNKPAL